MAGAEVVVDSSKLPTYASVLDGLDGIDLRVAHFLRDPRAAAYSWRRKKLQPDLGPGAFMERRGAGKSAVLWSVWNRSLEMLAGDRPHAYARVTYEEFLADPRAEAQRLLDAFALAGDLDPVFAGRGHRPPVDQPHRRRQPQPAPAGPGPAGRRQRVARPDVGDRPRRGGGPDLADAAAATGTGSGELTDRATATLAGACPRRLVLARLVSSAGCTDSPEPAQPRGLGHARAVAGPVADADRRRRPPAPARSA